MCCTHTETELTLRQKKGGKWTISREFTVLVLRLTAHHAEMAANSDDDYPLDGLSGQEVCCRSKPSLRCRTPPHTDAALPYKLHRCFPIATGTHTTTTSSCPATSTLPRAMCRCRFEFLSRQTHLPAPRAPRIAPASSGGTRKHVCAPRANRIHSPPRDAEPPSARSWVGVPVSRPSIRLPPS